MHSLKLQRFVVMLMCISVITVASAQHLRILWEKSRLFFESGRNTIISTTKASRPNIELVGPGEPTINLLDLSELKIPHDGFDLDESKHDVQHILYTISAHYNLPTRLLYALHLKETHGQCKVRSSKMAYGCFQFMTSTAKQFGLIGVKNGKQYDRRTSLIHSGDAAARYISWLGYVMYGDKADFRDWEQLRHILAAYNAGIARVFKSGSEPRMPSFYETQKYVHDIVGLAQGDAYFVGDESSLEEISLKTQVSEDAILQSNVHLNESTNVYRGMIIAMPDQGTQQAEVLVAPKMSLSKISAGTGVSAQEIMRVNGLTSSRLKPGMVLKIPVESAP